MPLCAWLISRNIICYHTRQDSFFLKLFAFRLFIYYMNALPVCMYVYHVHTWCLRRLEVGILSSRSGVKDGCEMCGCWILCKMVLLTTEPSVWPSDHLPFKRLAYFILCVSMFFLPCMHVHCVHGWYLKRSEDDRCPRTTVTDGCGLTYVCWELNLSKRFKVLNKSNKCD